MRIQYDNKFLFTGDESGNLKQWCIETQALVRDFGKIHDGMVSS
jgi:hypothetical protein